MERAGEIFFLQQYREDRRQEAMREPQKPRPTADDLLARYQRRDDSPRMNAGASRKAERNMPACGSFATAPSEPIVRYNHTKRLVGSRLSVSAGTPTVGTRMLLPEGTVYLGTCKHPSVVSVQTNLEQVYYKEYEMSSEAVWEAGSLPGSSAACIPNAQARGLMPRSDKEQQQKLNGAPQIVEGDILSASVAPFSPVVPAQPVQKRESQACGHHQLYTPALPPSLHRAPVCPICKGAGYVRADVPFGHPQFGKALACQCQQAKKHDERRQRLREQSQIDQLVAFRESSFSTFQLWLPGVQEAYEAALQFAQGPQGWLVLAGENGCGKTHLAVAIAKRCLDEGLITLFAVVPDLLDYLRSTFSPKTEECYDEAFMKMREADLVILDDLGAEANTSWAQEKLFQLLNYRYNARLATVLTTNKVGFVGIETRIRSRLSDRRLVRRVTMTEAQDFRLLDGTVQPLP